MKHVIENLFLLFEVRAHEQLGMQGALAHEHVSTQGTLAHKHVKTQGTLAHEQVLLGA